MRKYMDGHEYEYYCARLLKRKGFSKVKVTSASGDQGIDILAYKEGKKYGVQCKYYSHPVGNKAVQEAFAGAKFYDCDAAVVLTNNTFTQSARNLAQKTDVILWENSAVPRSVGFRITKWIGVFMCLAGLFGLFAAGSTTHSKTAGLMHIYFALLTAGGFFNFFEGGFAFMELCACIFYAAAVGLSVVIGAAADSNIHNTLGIMLSAFAFSLLRAFKLRRMKRISSTDQNTF